MKPIQSERIFDVATDLEESWEIISDTNALNRATGLPNVEFGTANPTSVAIRSGRAKLFGTAFEWDEYPFDWVKKQFFSVLRVFRKGPVAKFWGGIQLVSDEENEATTKVRVFGFFEPRSLLTLPLTYFIARRFTSQTAAYVQSQVKQRNAAVKTKVRHPRQTRANHKLLDQITAGIGNREQVVPDIMTLLNAHIKQASDEQVSSMRPYELADIWGQNRYDVLRAFLAATRHGLLRMEWVLICPNCRVPKEAFSSLREVTQSYHCDFCNVNYDTNLDRTTELRFSVAPQIRPFLTEIFCIGNPASFPHVLAQVSVPPGEQRELVFTGLAQDYDLRAARSAHHVSMERDRNGTEHTINLIYSDQGFSRSECRYPYPSTFTLQVTNQTSAPVLFLLEDKLRSDQAATALDVTLFEDFRSQFSHEILAPGSNLAIEHLTLMFTDLAASTAMYEKIGDGAAYSFVSKHFDFLTQIVKNHNGQIVKTIGDAVMAAFVNPADAVNASFAAQGEFEKFLINNSIKESVSLKIGIHHGPVIAVNANNQIDFFGQTVNLAARTLSAATGNDVILTPTLLQLSTVGILLSSQGYRPEEIQTDLKGFAHPVPLFRIIPRRQEIALKELPSLKLAVK